MAFFNDEELSRILSAHAGGDLARDGLSHTADRKCCVLQAAYGWEEYLNSLDDGEEATNVMNWFDAHYQPQVSVEAFLADLEKKGLA